MKAKRSVGIVIFGIIFILLAVSIPFSKQLYFTQATENEIRNDYNEIYKTQGVSPNIDIEKVLPILESRRWLYYYPHRISIAFLLVAYLLSGAGILLRKMDLCIYRMILVIFCVRIFYTFIQILGCDILSYLIPNIILYSKILSLDQQHIQSILYYDGVGILFSLFGICYFTRRKIKEQFK